MSAQAAQDQPRNSSTRRIHQQKTAAMAKKDSKITSEEEATMAVFKLAPFAIWGALVAGLALVTNIAEEATEVTLAEVGLTTAVLTMTAAVEDVTGVTTEVAVAVDDDDECAAAADDDDAAAGTADDDDAAVVVE